jgi:hypothetical protein
VPAFLELEGADCGEITIDGGDLSKAQNPLLLRQGAQQQAVKLRI